MSTPEGQIVRSILDYLAARHILAFRMNTGAMSAEHRGKKRFMRFGVPGMADILAFKKPIDRRGNEISVWIEVKSSAGKQSDLQRSFQAQVESHGHIYIVARCVEDVEAAL